MATVYRLLSDGKKALARKRARERYAETRGARRRKAYLIALQRIRNPKPPTLEAYGIHTTDEAYVDDGFDASPTSGFKTASAKKHKAMKPNMKSEEEEEES